MNEFERFIQFLITSINDIEAQYYQTEFDGFYGFRNRIRNLGRFQGNRFIRHTERGFAYELYYKLRTIIETHRVNNEFFPGYFLQGEIKKMDVPQILEIFGYTSMGSSYIPDLLFHTPGADGNAFVVEIKAQPELEGVEILYDLNKLAKFLRRLNYAKAVFLAVNISPETVRTLIRNYSRQMRNNFTEERLEDCYVIVKQTPGLHTPYFIQTLTQILA
ncbi:MAG: hypothetical protein IPP81_20295 [Chitinophagaceae bacterium]|nr:hypothetical protein [Chitinophagaceae bacterium]